MCSNKVVVPASKEGQAEGSCLIARVIASKTAINWIEIDTVLYDLHVSEYHGEYIYIYISIHREYVYIYDYIYILYIDIITT